MLTGKAYRGAIPCQGCAAPFSLEFSEELPPLFLLRSNRRASIPQSMTPGETATHHTWLPNTAAKAVATTVEAMRAPAQNLANSCMVEEGTRVIQQTTFRVFIVGNLFGNLASIILDQPVAVVSGSHPSSLRPAHFPQFARHGQRSGRSNRLIRAIGCLVGIGIPRSP